MTISRAEVLHRAHTRWGGINLVPYSQSTLTRTGYRADCSGLVCDALGIPPNVLGSWGGLNTVTLVSSGYVSRIEADDLRPGDLVGNMGPGTGGDAGHVQIFTDWVEPGNDGDSRYRCIEQRGGTSGPRDRDRIYDMARNGYRAYRYRDIADAQSQPGGLSVFQVQVGNAPTIVMTDGANWHARLTFEALEVYRKAGMPRWNIPQAEMQRILNLPQSPLPVGGGLSPDQFADLKKSVTDAVVTKMFGAK